MLLKDTTHTEGEEYEKDADVREMAGLEESCNSRRDLEVYISTSDCLHDSEVWSHSLLCLKRKQSIEVSVFCNLLVNVNR